MMQQTDKIEWREVELKELIKDMHQGINTVTDKVNYRENGYLIIQSKHITGGSLDLSDAIKSELAEIHRLKKVWLE